MASALRAGPVVEHSSALSALSAQIETRDAVRLDLAVHRATRAETGIVSAPAGLRDALRGAERTQAL